MSTPDVPGSCLPSPAPKEEEMGQVRAGLRHWAAPPAPASALQRRGRDLPGGQLWSHLLRRPMAPAQCLFTNWALRARETRLGFQARRGRCQPGRRGCLGPRTRRAPRTRQDGPLPPAPPAPPPLPSSSPTREGSGSSPAVHF